MNKEIEIELDLNERFTLATALSILRDGVIGNIPDLENPAQIKSAFQALWTIENLIKKFDLQPEIDTMEE